MVSSVTIISEMWLGNGNSPNDIGGSGEKVGWCMGGMITDALSVGDIIPSYTIIIS